MRLVSKSTRDTSLAGEILGEEIYSLKVGAPLIVALCGELGSGKTTFVKGIAEGLGIKKLITSPTFILIARYLFESKKRSLYHIDPYRLKDVGALFSLGFDEILKGEGNVVLIEWAARLRDYLPEDTIWVTLKHRGGNKREIVIS